MFSEKFKSKSLLDDKPILIVEPNANYRMTMKGFLQNFGIKNVKFTHSSKEAKNLLLTIDPGLIVCEWNQPDTNGIQLCKELKAQPRYANVPFLLLSVENLKKDIVLASEVGIDGYLLKPFSQQEFEASLQQTLKIVMEPNPINNLLAKAEYCLHQKLYDKAQKLVETAIKVKSNSARALSILASIHKINGLKDQAKSLLEDAVSINPSYMDAIRQLIEIYQEEEDMEKLKEYAEIANELSPENSKYILILARCHLEEGKVDLSEKLFKRAIRYAPKMAEAYKGLGKLYLIKDEYELAMKNLTKALDLDDNDISVLNSLGMAYVKVHRYRDGVEKYQTALKIKPNDHRILFNLGYANEKLEDIEKAQFYYKQAILHKPDFDKAARRLENLQVTAKAS